MTSTTPTDPSARAPAPVLAACGVTAGYGAHPVLRGLDLAVAAGEVVALLGANGAGKSTTLGLFLGFVRPQAGQVRVQGIDASARPEEARRRLACLPENVALYDTLSGRENLDYLLSLSGERVDAARLLDALDRAGLARRDVDRRVAGYSKGMRQKVAIALALARRVPALLLDEPTSGLDPHAAADFHALIGHLRGQGLATLMVTHDVLGAAALADRIGFLADGRLADPVCARTGDGAEAAEAAGGDDGSARYDLRALQARYLAEGGVVEVTR